MFTRKFSHVAELKYNHRRVDKKFSHVENKWLGLICSQVSCIIYIRNKFPTNLIEQFVSTPKPCLSALLIQSIEYERIIQLHSKSPIHHCPTFLRFASIETVYSIRISPYQLSCLKVYQTFSDRIPKQLRSATKPHS